MSRDPGACSCHSSLASTCASPHVSADLGPDNSRRQAQCYCTGPAAARWRLLISAGCCSPAAARVSWRVRPAGRAGLDIFPKGWGAPVNFTCTN
jgi:hypothetical protein